MVECPYCEHENELEYCDGEGVEQSETHERQCDNCDKYFVYYTKIEFIHDSSKAPCLNGEDHNYKETHTSPRMTTYEDEEGLEQYWFHVRNRCTYCDKEVPISEERKQEIIKEELERKKERRINASK